MKMSTKGRYGLRAMIELASHGSETPVPLSVIARSEEISERYLEQLMTKMKKADLITSCRGSTGGYCLARDAADISVGDILRAVEGNLNPVDCSVDSEAACENAGVCVAKYVWQKVNDSINQAVDGISLAELVAKIPENEEKQPGAVCACQK